MTSFNNDLEFLDITFKDYTKSFKIKLNFVKKVALLNLSWLSGSSSRCHGVVCSL